MKKIIFLDVDGTIVDYDNHIPDSAKIAIQQSRKNGHLVFLCTGRSKAEMPNKILDIGFDGIIGGNGSYIEYKNQVLMHQLIPYETAKQVVDWLESRGLEFYIESNNGLFASRNFRDAARQILRIYALGKGASEDQILNMEPEDALHGLVYGGELYRDDLNKISFILNSYQDHLDSKKVFPHLKAGTWGGRGESALFGELGVKDINKAHAVNIILKHLGANHTDTIAFGDAKVDIPMLEACHIGVAMGNGGPEILAMADIITDDVRQDGLYNAFRKLNLL
ncbi:MULTISPECIES: HAD family hydrolase [Streptococcus]|uniref:Cof-type HAD-IIB family hydrolase n=1 Tax=Streptococcus pseudopneumoniae TaxID=257758 RepID=A0AAW4C9K5_9STRE|nr:MULTISPECIES: HAD family hydrolase [Streptococcus]ETE04216.1 haloacid dehalogenase [Streptococcus pseudopneumoniae 22725]KPL38746.1 HAD family hydrolase [Streptococcus pseudopneumoniae]KPL39308.1 HAD family hydrolase [Streptococcus pseudopneumoniae]MBF9665900.1 Cof-type HAD-IIB family hydrolase [Streptococcus pseudopneumoniae]MBF9673807.1 Cof-type HAD-IIB family hydrolase [Streptococcus pseudopneumoniae]